MMRNVNLVVLLFLAFSSLVAASQSERQQRLWQTLTELSGDTRNVPLLSDVYVSAHEFRVSHLLVDLV